MTKPKTPRPQDYLLAYETEFGHWYYMPSTPEQRAKDWGDVRLVFVPKTGQSLIKESRAITDKPNCG